MFLFSNTFFKGIYIEMVKTNFNNFPNAIIRERNFGTSNLIYFIDNKKALTGPDIKTAAYTETIPDMSSANKKQKTIMSATRFGAADVAKNEFKAERPETMQGFKTGIVDNRLPMSFIPSEIKQYNVNAGGSAYNNGSGKVQMQESIELDPTKAPKLNTQWQSQSSFMSSANPNPFPIEINKIIKIR
jgi:hypothetical protein